VLYLSNQLGVIVYNKIVLSVLVSHLPYLIHLSLGQHPVTDYTPLHRGGHNNCLDPGKGPNNY
jgi:hypothetical protein